VALDEVYNIVGLDDLDQKNGDDVPGVAIETFVILLCLKNVDKVSSLC